MNQDNSLQETVAYNNRPNTHQLHFEDLVFQGKAGLEELNDKIEGFENQLLGNSKDINTSTKVDGSPAVILWSKFEGYPDNSICLKSFVNSENNCLSSFEDVDEKYGDRPEMAEKLKCALQLAKYIPEGEAWQGDCLFTSDSTSYQTIEGVDYITFQPNKIVYCIPSYSPAFEKVEEAEFGIAFHTIYKNVGNGQKRQYFNVDLSRVQAPEQFYLMTVALNASKDLKDYNFDKVHDLYEELKVLEQTLKSSPEYENLVQNDAFMKFWETFENKKIADEKNLTIDVDTFFDELWGYIEEKQTIEFQKKLTNLKTVRGKSGAIDKWVDSVQYMSTFLKENKQILTTLIKAFNKVVDIKMCFWEGFKSTYTSDYDQFYLSKTKGYIPADMEGIAMSDNEGNIVKIVDRTTFSSNNRNPDLTSGWEH